MPESPRPVPVDAVVIGRNEGARLQACLNSLLGQVRRVIYVDSGSTDGSVPMAQAMGVQVVALDMTMPFTAARARNAGWHALQGDPGFCAIRRWRLSGSAGLDCGGPDGL